jgi:hypothetical protein
MFSTLLYIFLAYILYLVIFRVVIPIWRTTRAVRKAFREAQDLYGPGNMQEHPHQSRPPEPKPKKGDYIEFEEVK